MPEYVDRVDRALSSYAPEGGSRYSKDGVSVLCRPFHTTKESRLEIQPHVCKSGALIVWDGRLDNRTELISRFSYRLSGNSPDAAVVAAAYEQWGTGCFANLIGDWAASICSPADRCLILARDPLGVRPLFYRVEDDQITWSTVLDPVVLFSATTFPLCEEYVAGWLTSFPAAHLTPYVGIQSVPPSSFVLFQPQKQVVQKYWDFAPDRAVRHRSDREYEEHFRATFAQAVRRRLRSDTPVLAELSGGMDSSAIVCLADALITHGNAETVRLDTLSYFNDSEPNWNERPYFTAVEKRRGRIGCHIDCTSQSVNFEFPDDPFAATPGSKGIANAAIKQFAACLDSLGTRVLLSGIGGDEITGGVPTPIPELGDLLAGCHMGPLTHQLKAWALQKRRPWHRLLIETVSAFLPPTFIERLRPGAVPPWLNHAFSGRFRAALTGYRSRFKVVGPRPSFQENLLTVEALRRQLSSFAPLTEPPYEIRFPYLDRDLLEFVYAIPREQLVRPGQRRSLMRRALAGIVPDEILNRKRKASVARSPLMPLFRQASSILQEYEPMICQLGIVNQNSFREEIQKARLGMDVPLVGLMRTLWLENWLRHVGDRNVIRFSTGTDKAPTALSASAVAS